MSSGAIVLAAILLMAPAPAGAQSSFPAAQPCLGQRVPLSSVNALADCLSDPNPAVRDAIAFEGLSALLRSGNVEVATLRGLRDRLLVTVRQGGPALQTSFSVLTLAEVARTDRVKPWMSDAEREAMVQAAAGFLSSVTDYRAFT